MCDSELIPEHLADDFNGLRYVGINCTDGQSELIVVYPNFKGETIKLSDKVAKILLADGMPYGPVPLRFNGSHIKME